MEESKNNLAEYEIDESTKGAKGANGKEYKAEKIERSKSNEE